MKTPPLDDSNPSAPPFRKARTKKKRDLTQAATLRPAEVFELYGIPSSTLCELCKHPDPARRIPSRKIRGRRGKKGLRLIPHDEFKLWLAKWDHNGEQAA